MTAETAPPTSSAGPVPTRPASSGVLEKPTAGSPAPARHAWTSTRSGPLPRARRVRLRTVPMGGLPVALDGAWWPRTNDLPAELPGLLAAVPHGWRGIASASVDGDLWQAMPGRMLIGSHVVRLHRARVTRDPHTICLLSPGHGRWDLLVVPPAASPAEAALLMDQAVGAQP